MDRSQPTAPQPSGFRRPPQQGRRLTTIVLGAGMVALAACGGGGSASNDDVTLRFTWWGSDVRHEATQQVIEAFNAEHPGVTVRGEFGEWSGYWDKLSTQIAANDAPDIIQMDEAYLREYASRGALLDLAEQGDLDTSAYDPNTLATGETDDGLYALSSGVNSLVVMANPAILDEAGVELPDDSTWTWDDYRDLAVEISEATEDGVYGAQGFGNDSTPFSIWARQHGESYFTADGFGYTPATLQSFFEYDVAMREAGATPVASITSESYTASLDQSLLATGRVGMGYAWSNQLNALSSASGEELIPLRIPSQEGSATANGSFYKSSMFWSVSSRTEYPQEAALFLDYVVNSEEAGEILLAERAVPPNPQIREMIIPDLDDADATAVAYIEEIADEIGDPPVPPPVGGPDVQQVYQRFTDGVLFDRMAPAEAAQGFSDEAASLLGE